jgi:F-type H+-transporting ATPase subunit gamma
MSSAKVLRKRIRGVKNTKKITRTMEMVASSKLKRAQGRVTAAQPYMEKLLEMLGDLTREVPDELVKQYPLLERREEKRVLIFLLTSQRGLCGGFNANLIRRARKLIDDERAAGKEVELHIAGRKGLQFFKFRKIQVDREVPPVSDNPSFEDAEELGKTFVDAFLSGRVDAVKIVFAHFESALRQPPTVLKLLPIEPQDTGDAEATTRPDFEFFPDPQTILNDLFPMYLRNMVLRVLLESVASEQSARRIAMKNATDAAGDMIKSLTRQFNRARQAQITQEIAEIVGGAEAIK